MIQTLTVGVALLVVVATVPGCFNMTGAPNPKSVLNAAGDQLKRGPFSLRIRTTAAVTGGEQDNSRSQEHRCLVATPERLAVLASPPESASSHVYVDGFLTSYAPHLNRFAKVPIATLEASETAQELATATLGLPLLKFLYLPETTDLLTENATGIRYVGRESLDGGSFDCHRLRITSHTMDLDVWVDSRSPPVIRKIVPRADRALQTRLPPGTRLEVALEFRDWSFPADVNDPSFTFAPPPTAHRVASSRSHPLEGLPAPSFRAFDVRGKEVMIDDILGQDVIVLDFWASYCQPCLMGLPQLSKIAKEYADRQVTVYAVNLDESADLVAEMAERMGLSMPVCIDQGGQMGGAYGVSTIPHTVLIGRDGKVQAVHPYLVPPQRLRAELDQLVAGRSLLPDE